MGYLAGSAGIGKSMVAFAIVVITGLTLWLLTIRAHTGRRPYVRPLPAFDQLPSELGQAAESGASLHVALGTGGVGGERTLTSLAGLQVLEGIADAAVAYGTLPVVTVGDPTLLPLAQDVLRCACIRAGVPERYDPTAVRFIAFSPSAYALGARDVVGHERVAGNVLAGSFGEEVVLLAHGGEGQGLFQTAAADRPRALSALYPTDTLLAAGEELYAGGARLTGLPRYLASLSVQDGLRFLVVLIILLAIVGIRVF